MPPITGASVVVEQDRIVVEAPDHLGRTLHAAAREADEAAGHDPGAQHQHALALVPGPRRPEAPPALTSVVASAVPAPAWTSAWSCVVKKNLRLGVSGPGADPSRFARIANWPSVRFWPRGDPPGRQSRNPSVSRVATASRPSRSTPPAEHAGHPRRHGEEPGRRPRRRQAS